LWGNGDIFWNNCGGVCVVENRIVVYDWGFDLVKTVVDNKNKN
jgi:hypothetical protein